MAARSSTLPQVLIVGAGPTGLVLGLWLTRLGVPVRIVDLTAEPGTTSRALAVQARTLELYRQAGLADEVVEHGHRTPAANLWVRGAKVARVPLTEIGQSLSPYPFLLIYPQDKHERLLIARLRMLGVEVDRRTELVGFEASGAGIRARLRGAEGREETCAVQYLAGCDGASSRVREGLGLGFPGATYRQLFYVADADISGPPADGELHVDLDEADFLAVFPLSGDGRVRLIGTVRDERAEHPEHLRFEDVSQRSIRHLKVAVRKVNWFSTYRVHHRVTVHFREGRVFLLGDAAHIHSPAGGQGMNTGIGDAINLAWKLAAVAQGRAPEGLLDSYEAERIGFARRLVASTDRVFSFATAESSVANLLRTRLVPWLLPRAVAVKAVRNFAFRTVAQITLDYRKGPLSAGRAGKVRGGDRLPWVRIGGRDNFAGLSNAVWQVHVYGQPSAALTAWCAAQDLPLETFPWSREHAAAGLARDALYLLRPDSYVALADPSANPEVLAGYFVKRRITPGASSASGARQCGR